MGHVAFSVRAGGAGGHPPVLGVPIEEFVYQDEVLEVVKAVTGLLGEYNESSDDSDTSLRHIIGRWGPDAFERRYRARPHGDPTDCDSRDGSD